MNPGKSINGLVPPKAGLQKELTSLTPLSGSAGKMHVLCLHCGTGFFRFASHVRRRGKNYCSVACKKEKKKVRVHTNCVVGGDDMEQTPSDAMRVVTCSKECSSNRRRGEAIGRSWPEYKALVSKVAAIKTCCRCGSKSGPWVVNGLMQELNEEKASLWCRPCHLKEIQKKANDKKRATPESLEVAKRMLEKHGYVVLTGGVAQ